jgi:hypothetical protein
VVARRRAVVFSSLCSARRRGERCFFPSLCSLARSLGTHRDWSFSSSLLACWNASSTAAGNTCRSCASAFFSSSVTALDDMEARWRRMERERDARSSEVRLEEEFWDRTRERSRSQSAPEGGGKRSLESTGCVRSSDAPGLTSAGEKHFLKKSCVSSSSNMVVVGSFSSDATRSQNLSDCDSGYPPSSAVYIVMPADHTSLVHV